MCQSRSIDADTMAVKNKVSAESLGAAIPNGVVFDLTDPMNARFYLVDVGLSTHDFNTHILAQVTKFLRFLRSPDCRMNLQQSF